MVSPRRRCISSPVNRIVSPPSSRMATSKETRVRVDGRSKIIASTLPASGRGAVWLRRTRFSRSLSSRMRRRAGASISARSRKWRTIASPGGPGRHRLLEGDEGTIEAIDRFVDLGFADIERRQQADDILAGGGAEQPGVTHGGYHLADRPDAADANEQPLAAHLGDQPGMSVDNSGEALLEVESHAAHMIEEA